MTNSGVVKSITGEVKAIAVGGTERLLHVGDTVLMNEIIITGNAGAISLWLSDGTPLDLGQNAKALLSDDFFNQDLTEALQNPVSSNVEDEVAAIQQALANDETFDPSKLEAPAAGGIPATGDTGGGGGGGGEHSFVDVDYLNLAMTPDSGFDTIGISANFTQPPQEPLIQAVSLTPVAGLNTLVPAVQVTDHNGLDVGDNEVIESSPTSVAGNFVLISSAGVLSIDVGGSNISEASLLTSGTSPIAITTGEGGTLNIVGYDAASGTVSYSYLASSGAKDHSAGDNSIVDQIDITMTDVNNVTSAPSVLDVLITDTVPQAFDNNEQLSQNQGWLVDNVIFNAGSDGAANDIIGIDGGGKLTSVTQGNDTKSFLNATDLINIGGDDLIQFDTNNGTLYIREDGQYWYQNTTTGGSTEVTDTFTYQLVDSDFGTNNSASMSTADLTITQVLGDNINTGDTTV